MGGWLPDPPSPDPGIGDAARMNAQLSREALDFYRQVYAEDIRPGQQEDREMRRTLLQNFLTDAQTQREFAQEQNQYYRQTFRPVEEQMVRDAMDMDSDENIRRAQGEASAAVTQAFSNAQQQASRNASRMGINPNSGAFAALNARLTNQQALSNAAEQNNAARQLRDKALGARAGVSNFGRGLPNTAATYFGLANQSGGMAGQQSLAGLEAARAGAAFMGQGFGAAGALNSSAGNLYGQDFNARMAGFDSQMRLIGGLVGAGTTALTAMSSKDMKEGKKPIGEGKALRGIKELDIDSWNYKGDPEKHVGPYAEDFKREFGLGTGKTIALQDAIGVTMKAVQDLAEEIEDMKGEKKPRGLRRANGGKVHKGKGKVEGPGGPVDDKIPAMLSNGEYVLPADTVQKIGVQKLDELVKRTHVPAAVQRGLRRKK